MTITWRLRKFALEVMHSLRTSPVFLFAVLITLGLAGLNGLMVLLMQLQPGFLGMAHFTEPSHRVHDLTYGFLFGVAVVGMLAQLRRPSKNVASMVMALIPWVGLLLAAVLSADAGVIVSTERMSAAAVILIAALLHPTGRDFFSSFSVSRVNRVMLALLIIAAVPLLAYASTNIRLQATVADSHAAMGHYGFMAAFSFTVIGVGLLASTRADGWRLTAWVAGLLPALLGVISMIYPNVSSSLGLVWELAAIAWGAGFVAAAQLHQGRGVPDAARFKEVKLEDDARVRPDRESTTSIPLWKNVIGGIALVVVLMPVILFLSGRGAGHGPGMVGPGGHGGDTSPIDGAPELAITADQLAFAPDRIELNTGEPVDVVLTSKDTRHDLVADEVDFYLAADRDETATGSLVFYKPGTYVGYCSVPGHREAGMEIEIVVTNGGHDPSTGHTVP